MSTPDKFKKIVHTVVDSKNPHLSSFGEADLNALARDFSSGKADVRSAIERLREIYDNNDVIGRADFDEIEKRLNRV